MWLPAPASFTGEDCIEMQVHGGMAVRSALLGALGSISDCRLAEPGEFTRRAFANGKLDLDEVEALGDLLTARTERQRVLALEEFSGRISQRALFWRTKVLEALALIEANIDFVDESDAPGDVESEVAGVLCEVAENIRDSLTSTGCGRSCEDRFSCRHFWAAECREVDVAECACRA